MRKILIGAVIALAGVLVFRSCSEEKKEKALLQENTMLIQQQIKNVSKLIVSEGHFAEVYSFKDSEQLFGPLITADKKALVVVNAEVTVAYDLGQMQFDIDEAQKTLRILKIPPPEIKLNPDFEYYDITADYFNPFKAEDYNRIKRDVNLALLKKIELSTLKSNAENRLMSELSKLFILTNSLGWRLEHNGRNIDNIEELQLSDQVFVD